MTTAEKLPNANVPIAGKQRSKRWEERMQQRQKMQAMKLREREMKQVKEDEAERKREIRREREQKAAEKARLEAMAARVRIPLSKNATNRPTDECQKGYASCS